MRRLRCCNKKKVICFIVISLAVLGVFNGRFQTNLTTEKNAELNSILVFLNSFGGFLVDVEKLSQLNSSENLLLKNECASKLQTNFGITDDTVSLFHLKFYKESISKYCTYELTNGSWYENERKKVLSSIYFYCKQVKVQVSVFYKRGDFYWIPSDDHAGQMHKPSWFGDVPRGLNKFEVISYFSSSDAVNYIRVPSNIEKFLFDYKQSRFLECNRTMLKLNFERSNGTFIQNKRRNSHVMPRLRYITRTLEDLGKHYWLASGTLLGWYRDCGIVPHTHDADLFIWFHEYDRKIKRKFLGNPFVFVWLTHGFVDNGYEIRLTSGGFTFDLITVYKLNNSVQTASYHVKLRKYTQYIPNFNELCSGELLNSKFSVPCDPITYLTHQYGESWSTPTVLKYRLKNIAWSKPEEWPAEDIQYILRYYYRNGTYNENRTMSHIMRNIKHKHSTETKS